MSKKSRRRNRRLLGMLAAGLGAAALAKRGVPAAANVDSGRGSGLRDTVDSAKNWITKKADVLPSPKKISTPILNTAGGIHAGKPAKGALLKARRLTAGNKIPPSMRGGASYAQGATTFMPSNRQWPGGYVKGTFKKGGRVTGIAKRGFGRALMKGKK
jgi:hypothetical protein